MGYFMQNNNPGEASITCFHLKKLCVMIESICSCVCGVGGEAI